ncbi:hypothetical protein Bca52824_017025 [Brassica carinata]|uniref:ATP-dependent Clp protease proteolytic subunit n=1 Tax=Brassica carinata TaxID=52824 RepID=A0A8X7VMS0_BRACI|nr:hypothetical protein Bca52824_017025 [Brassica carinata]
MRQATDVEHRDLEYEQGRTVFTPTEDAQDIADCLKYFLRESEKFPSSPGLLAFGSKGIPYCMTNTQVMFHQPLGDTDRDNFLKPSEAKDYGLIGAVIDDVIAGKHLQQHC